MSTNGNLLGDYLRDRRARLDPAAFGLPLTRRRTPGLRREEVAQRAHVSATWYTWLEQGRGGAPSEDVLERIARALMLTEAEREHAFLLAFGRPPGARYQPAQEVSPLLQRVLDAMELSPALVRTSTWDVVAWNRAATVVLADYGAVPPEQRNILRTIFRDPEYRARQPDWDRVARFAVAAFRGDAARAGAAKSVEALVDELCAASPEFDALWRDNEVRRTYDEGPKKVLHPTAGIIELDYSSFAVDGRSDLSMIVYSAAAPADADRIRALLRA